MIIKSSTIQELEKIFSEINNKQFNIETQYKFIKIKKKLKEEIDIINNQIQILIDNYGEKDKNNNLVLTENGGIKIKAEALQECENKIKAINELNIQLPDIYFSLEELKPLNLSFYQLEILEPFIK